MRGYKNIQFVGSLTSTASSTATIFAAGGSGTRWVLTKGLIGCVTPAAGATLTFAEVYPSGTAGAGWSFRVPYATNAQSMISLDLGDRGLEASSTNSRFVWSIDGANATANIVFVGYYR